MGTRSLTRIFNNDAEILCLYRQMDGYPSGHGADLAGFLDSGKLVNGIPVGEDRRLFNGMGCLAAQMVSHLKGSRAGGVYIYAPGSKDVGEEYVYEVHGGNAGPDFKPLSVAVKCVSAYDGKTLYEGDIAGFAAFCNAPDSDDEVAHV